MNPFWKLWVKSNNNIHFVDKTIVRKQFSLLFHQKWPLVLSFSLSLLTLTRLINSYFFVTKRMRVRRKKIGEREKFVFLLVFIFFKAIKWRKTFQPKMCIESISSHAKSQNESLQHHTSTIQIRIKILFSFFQWIWVTFFDLLDAACVHTSKE